jgi:hypothetical protein
MTLSELLPTDQELVSMLPYWIRRTRGAVNDINAGALIIPVTELGMNGETTLAVDTDLEDVAFEIVLVSAAGGSTLQTITNGQSGQIKIFYFLTNLVNMEDSATKANGTFYLNQLPAGSNLDPSTDDIIALMNVGGDQDLGLQGFWKEVFRTLTVR